MGNERAIRSFGHLAQRTGGGNVFGQIEIMNATVARGFSDLGVDEVRQRADGDVSAIENLPPLGIFLDVGNDARYPLRRDPVDRGSVGIHHCQLIVARPMKEIRDHPADFSGAENNDVAHGLSRMG